MRSVEGNDGHYLIESLHEESWSGFSRHQEVTVGAGRAKITTLYPETRKAGGGTLKLKRDGIWIHGVLQFVNQGLSEL